MTIGERIRKKRKEIGLTQGQLAERSGIHPVSIRKYETNKMEPRISQIERLAGALECDPAYLAGWSLGE